MKVGGGTKLASVLLGTLAGGFIWRCRGESGWGSSWGLYSVGLVLILLIYIFYGKKKGMKFELIPIGALLTGLGVTGYGTVIDQMAGVLYSDLPYQGEVVYSPISPWSGAVIILIMGITLIPLYAFFIGTLFSDRDYKITHYLIAIAIFFGVGYICKATIAPLILEKINPEQVGYAALGLKDAGFDYATPYRAYMAHFGQRKWTQDIPYFENYYMSVEHISDLIALFAVTLYPLIAFKDRVTSGVTAFITVFTGIATTALSPLISSEYRTGFFTGIKLPRFIAEGAGWGLWEFATGAAVGFFTMLIIALLPSKYTAQSDADGGSLCKNRVFRCIFNMAAVTFVFGVVPARIIGIRLGKLLRYEGITENGDTVGTIVMIALSVIFGIFVIIALKKNILDLDILPLRRDPYNFASAAFVPYLLLCFGAYFFLNHGYLLHFPYAEMTSLSSAVSIITGGEHIITVIMLLTFLLLMLIYARVRKKSES